MHVNRGGELSLTLLKPTPELVESSLHYACPVNCRSREEMTVDNVWSTCKIVTTPLSQRSSEIERSIAHDRQKWKPLAGWAVCVCLVFMETNPSPGQSFPRAFPSTRALVLPSHFSLCTSQWEYVDKLLEKEEPALSVAKSPPPKDEGGGAVG